MKIDYLAKHGVNFYSMEDKICIVRQPAGLGDILFCQKIVYKIKEKYNLNVIWPVSKEYSSIESDINSPAKFCSIDADFPFKNLFGQKNIINNDKILYIPLQDADQYYPGLCMMDSKYKFVGLKYNDWQLYLHLNRDKDKEQNLKRELGISKGEDYVILNKTYGSLSAPAICRYLLNFKSKFKIIELKKIEGYSLFNWSLVLEQAKEIHTVDTSLMYIMEKLNITGKMFCYSRYFPPSFHDVTHLFKNNWIYVKS